MNEDKLKADFRYFLFAVWKYLGLPEPTRRQYAMAQWLQHGPRRRGIKAFRGIAKSWITAAFVVWLLYRNQQLNCLVVSASKQRADNFTIFCLDIIKTVPFLQHLHPRDDQRCSRVEFDVNGADPDQNPSLRSKGIFGQLTGDRADIIIADDVETPKTADTQLQREKLAERVKEFDSILKPEGNPDLLPGDPVGIIFLGTPQTEQSLYHKMAKRGFVFRVWPSEYPDDAQIETYGSELAPDILEDVRKNPKLVGHSTEPTRFPDSYLDELKLSLGRSTYAMQFMLDTRLSDEDRYPLKLSDLIVMPCDRDMAPQKIVHAASPEYVINDLPNVGMGRDRLYRPVPLPPNQVPYLPYQGKLLTIDPSGRGSDETAYNITAMLNGQIFLLEAGAFRDGYGEDTLRALVEAAKRWGANYCIIEANFGDGMFTALLTPYVTAIHPMGMEEVKHSVQKEKRIIDTLEPVLNQHRLIVDPKVIQADYDSTQDLPSETAHQYQLFWQLTHITREKGCLVHDDRLDALAIAVAYWVEHMAVDRERKIQEEKDRQFEEEIKRFMQHTIGWKSTGPTWVRRAGSL